MSDKKGLYANIHAKRERIKNGSGEKMREPDSKGAPSAKDFADSAKTAGKRPTKYQNLKDKMPKKETQKD